MIPRPVWLVLVGVFLMWAVAANWGGGDYCSDKQHTGKENCAQYDTAGIIAIKILDTLDHHEGTVVGIGTAFLALFTWLLAKSTDALRRLAESQENSTKTIERAYVKMSHHPPGLAFAPFGELVICHLGIEVKNHGSTPARVTRIHSEFVFSEMDDRIPRHPIYRGTNTVMTSGAFLVNGDSFNVPVETRVPADRFDVVNHGVGPRLRLFVIGYADYIDAFNVRHRAGYARRFSPEAGREGLPNNLVFVDFPRWNYDRIRQHGEGDDWT